MAEISIEQFSDYIYNLLPNIYKLKDREQDENRPPLYLYMRSMYCGVDIEAEDGTVSHVNGAGETLLNKANTFVYLIDPDKCPDDLFPYLFESFGLSYNDSIETRTDDNGKKIIYYHRKFLNNLGELIKRLGTIAGIRYLVRVLTGLEFDYEYFRGYDENNKLGRFLVLHLKASDVEEINDIPHSIRVIEAFLKPFVPFYITSVTFGDAVIDTQQINGENYVIPTPMHLTEQTMQKFE